MKIDILCGSGSPDGVTLQDLHGSNGRMGVGGSEYALLTLCEGWSKAGHTVTLYNNGRNPDSPFEHRRASTFEKSDNRDVFITFREPTPKILEANGLKVFWSCDQFTAGDFGHFAKLCDKVVTISPYHSAYFSAVYQIENSIPIDLPVRIWEYEQPIEKVRGRLIFTSVPDRGLHLALRTFGRIKEGFPEATLVVTSDYRLWGSPSPMNDSFFQQARDLQGVRFLGAVPRTRLVEEQLKAEIHYYPCVYEELFCIAVAESQVAGVLPISTPKGALGTTNMGILIDGNAEDPAVQNIFVDKTLEYLTNGKLLDAQKQVQSHALKRFALDRIMQKWEKVFHAG